MKKHSADLQLISNLFFRLLLIQIVLAIVSVINGTISGLFGSNFVGADVMSAIGLYAPINMFLGAVSTVFVGGSQIICGKYMGKNQVERTQSIFSLDFLTVTVLSLCFILVLGLGAVTGLTRIFTADPVMLETLNQYVLGQIIGILPLLLGQQTAAFLSLENQTKRTTLASVFCVAVNVMMNFLFVAVLKMGAFGLGLAASLGTWAFFIIHILYYLSGKSMLKLDRKPAGFGEVGDIIKTGYPGALSSGYQTIRGLIVNALILRYVGSAGLSAFSASDSVLRLFWAVPAGIAAVSRMLLSIYIGEEDRKSLADVMRVVMYRCIPLMCAISALIIALAVPFTRLFYRDPADPVYSMTVNAYRILPLCMPLSVICMNFTCYAQASGKQFLVHILSILDGVICVAGFAAILIPSMGMNGVYIANVLNGIICAAVVAAYSLIIRKKFPRNMEELMVIPDDFGAGEDQRIDITVTDLNDVMKVSEQVIAFCRDRGIDGRRAYFSGLFLEEMAGNVIDHGFRKDNKIHSVDIRVVHKADDVILRIKDDCIPFDPAERRDIVDPKDRMKNVGIRMVYDGAKDIKYQNILGLNVLTIRT